jgi:hypothetical protein
MIDDLNDWAPLSNSVLLLSFLSTSIIHGLQKKTSTVDVEVRELLDHIQISVHGLTSTRQRAYRLYLTPVS